MNRFSFMILFFMLSGFMLPYLRYLSGYMPTELNNLIRFMSGSVFMIAVSLFYHRRNPDLIFEFRDFVYKHFYIFILISVFISVNMYYLTPGVFRTSTITGISIIISTPVITSLMTAAVFNDYSRVRDPFFVLGLAAAITGYMMFMPAEFAEARSREGVLFILTAVAAQIFFNILVSRLSRHREILIYINTVSVGFASVWLFFTAVYKGTLVSILNIEPIVFSMVCLAGIMGTFINMIFVIMLPDKIGGRRFQRAQLLTPFFMVAVSSFIFKEKIPQKEQIIGTVIVICGVFVSIFGHKIFKVLRRRLKCPK